MDLSPITDKFEMFPIIILKVGVVIIGGIFLSWVLYKIIYNFWDIMFALKKIFVSGGGVFIDAVKKHIPRAIDKNIDAKLQQDFFKFFNKTISRIEKNQNK